MFHICLPRPPKHVRIKFLLKSMGQSGGSSVRRPGSEDPQPHKQKVLTIHCSTLLFKSDPLSFAHSANHSLSRQTNSGVFQICLAAVHCYLCSQVCHFLLHQHAVCHKWSQASPQHHLLLNLCAHFTSWSRHWHPTLRDSQI